MLARAMTIGVAALVAAVPAASQQRGTLEFGAFASNTSFDKSLGMNGSWGAGGRIGAFVFPRLLIEFEGGGGRSDRILGLPTVNQTSIAGRLTAIPVKLGRLSLLLGGGIVHTDYQFEESYGFQGLIGAKLALSETVALRVDGFQDWNANPADTKNHGLHVGLSIYRSPATRTSTVTNTVTVAAVAPEAAPSRAVPSVVAGPMIAEVPERADSVSASETSRLRALEHSYKALRDSLAMPSALKPKPESSAEALATMNQVIYFHHDRSDLGDSAKTILDEKITVFRANPAMRIVIVGFASQPGTEAYNMTLGLRRAEAAKAYLVSQGVDPIRVEISTRGEGQLVVEGPGEIADAANRRGQFRLLIADPYLAAPNK